MSERHPHGQATAEIVDEHILHIVMDRVEKKNSFTPKIIIEISEHLTRLDEDPDLWVGVISFAGDHSSGGLDMPLFFGPDADRTALDRGVGVDPFGLRQRLRKPLVTAVQGITYTAAIEMALAGDIIISAEDAKFSQIEPRRGLTALGGATIRYVERAGWGNAMLHLLTGDVFDAAEAYRIGLVQEVVPVGRQVERALEIAREIARCAPIAVRETIANARIAILDGEQAAIDDMPRVRREFMKSEDITEGIASFRERRDARFTGR